MAIQSFVETLLFKRKIQFNIFENLGIITQKFSVIHNIHGDVIFSKEKYQQVKEIFAID